MGQTSANSIAVTPNGPLGAPDPAHARRAGSGGTVTLSLPWRDKARAGLRWPPPMLPTAGHKKLPGKTHMTAADPTERIERAEIEDTSLLAF